MSRSFPVIILPEPGGGYFVQCPILPGCYSQAETVEECVANIREAIELALEDMAARGESLPPCGPALIAKVTVAA
ncbi:MAG TPA: type II toxin-antitoxin system HicB family antitoxin [Phycisphaerales bacterium]|nr:type II toxin-antitoxin system HicB family antitoxin [Phycisphaerales bacterium]